jgi:DNA helicase-2/ATP-dependent DNA helicase PcrA
MRNTAYSDRRTGGSDGVFKRNAAASFNATEAKRPVLKMENSIIKKGSDYAIEKPAYDEGDRVRHVKFGEGRVVSIEQGPRDYRVTVDFDEAGRKVMYAAFAKLEKL